MVFDEWIPGLWHPLIDSLCLAIWVQLLSAVPMDLGIGLVRPACTLILVERIGTVIGLLLRLLRRGGLRFHGGTSIIVGNKERCEEI